MSLYFFLSISYSSLSMIHSSCKCIPLLLLLLLLLPLTVCTLTPSLLHVVTFIALTFHPLFFPSLSFLSFMALSHISPLISPAASSSTLYLSFAPVLPCFLCLLLYATSSPQMDSSMTPLMQLLLITSSEANNKIHSWEITQLKSGCS